MPRSARGPHFPDSDPLLTHKLLPHRRISTPAARSRRPAASAGGGRRSSPSTPLLRWKFDDADRSTKPPQEPGRKPRRRAGNAAEAMATAVPARKLAAVMWQHAPVDAAVGGGGARADTRLGFEPVAWHLHTPHVCHRNSRDELGSPNPRNTHKLEHAAALPNSAMEKATKWDPVSAVSAKRQDGAYLFSSHLKDRDGDQVGTLQTELEHAQNRITELEAERLSSKRKMDHLLRKITEEKASWRSKEHEKIRAIIDEMKDELNRERRNRKQVEIVKSKLVNELAEAKLSAKRFLQDYEKERKGREIMEEVCDELAKEMAEDKAEVEALKRDCLRIREEVEEERRMLQMAEVWREERVQMKLIDAKVTLEEKYKHVSKLESELVAFLRVRSSSNPDTAEIREAESLREAAKFIKIEDIEEFTYQPPPASEDIFSVFEELRPREEANTRDIEQCYGYSPASHGTKIHTVSPATDLFLEKPMKRYDNRLFDRNADPEDDSGWETVSQNDEQGSSNSHAGSDPSVNGMCRGSNASASGADWENGDNDTLNSEIIEVCSETTRQSRNKASSISRLWRSSCPNNGENYKKILVEAINGRLSNGRASTGTLSPDIRSGDVDLSPPSVGHWSSPDAANPHITRGMKGCIEWPRGTQKHSLKAKLLEARMESQKIQLRHALKQKI